MPDEPLEEPVLNWDYPHYHLIEETEQGQLAGTAFVLEAAFLRVYESLGERQRLVECYDHSCYLLNTLVYAIHGLTNALGKLNQMVESGVQRSASGLIDPRRLRQ